MIGSRSLTVTALSTGDSCMISLPMKFHLSPAPRKPWPRSGKKLCLISGGIPYAEGVNARSPGLQCEASYPGFKPPASSTLKALLQTRFRSAITPSG